jgi:hypothetical protein
MLGDERAPADEELHALDGGAARPPGRDPRRDDAGGVAHLDRGGRRDGRRLAVTAGAAASDEEER